MKKKKVTIEVSVEGVKVAVIKRKTKVMRGKLKTFKNHFLTLVLLCAFTTIRKRIGQQMTPAHYLCNTRYTGKA